MSARPRAEHVNYKTFLSNQDVLLQLSIVESFTYTAYQAHETIVDENSVGVYILEHPEHSFLMSAVLRMVQQ